MADAVDRKDPEIRAFFHEGSNTISYLVADGESGMAVVIDPVLDFRLADGAVSFAAADAILQAAAAARLRVEWILETHIHADHISAADYIRGKTGAAIGIGSRVREVVARFEPEFSMPPLEDQAVGFDRLLGDGDRISLGNLEIEVLHTPGHTPADAAYKFGNCIFVGDTLFMPDSGTARCDFPGGDCRQLFRSIRRILSFPPETRLFMCHDYGTAERKGYTWETTVAAQRGTNIHIGGDAAEDDFVALRLARDAVLSPPALMLPALQCNIRAGRLPQKDHAGKRHFRIPLRMPAESS